MCKWPPVYIKYTHLSLSYWLCVFQVYNRWCVCMEEGWRNSRRYVRLDIIQRNLRRKWRLSAKSSADFLYEMWHYMYVHVSLISDRYILSLKKTGGMQILPFRFHHFPFSVSRVFQPSVLGNEESLNNIQVLSVLLITCIIYTFSSHIETY